MHTPRHALIGSTAAALCLALGGCTVSVMPVPDVTPSTDANTYTCANPGSTPTPCTPEMYAQEKMDDALYERAQGVYKQLFAEVSALQRSGGTTEASATLQATAGGPYLSGQVSQLTALVQAQAKAVGETKIKRMEPFPGATARGYTTAIVVCIDSTAVQIKQGETVIGKGVNIAERVYFKTDGDTIKAWDAEKLEPTSIGC